MSVPGMVRGIMARIAAWRSPRESLFRRSRVTLDSAAARDG